MKNKPQKRLKHPTSSIPLDIWDPSIQKKIEKLIKFINPRNQPFANQDVIQELMVTALKAAQAQIGRGDLKLLSRALRELRYAFKIFQSYRHRRKVTIFGSARTKSSSPTYKLTQKFAKKITQKGFMVITGASPQQPRQRTGSSVKSRSSVVAPALTSRIRSSACRIRPAPLTWQAVPMQTRTMCLPRGVRLNEL